MEKLINQIRKNKQKVIELIKTGKLIKYIKPYCDCTGKKLYAFDFEICESDFDASSEKYVFLSVRHGCGDLDYKFSYKKLKDLVSILNQSSFTVEIIWKKK